MARGRAAVRWAVAWVRAVAFENDAPEAGQVPDHIASEARLRGREAK